MSSDLSSFDRIAVNNNTCKTSMQQIEMSNKLHSERDELLVIDSLACVNMYV